MALITKKFIYFYRFNERTRSPGYECVCNQRFSNILHRRTQVKQCSACIVNNNVQCKKLKRKCVRSHYFSVDLLTRRNKIQNTVEQLLLFSIAFIPRVRNTIALSRSYTQMKI